MEHSPADAQNTGQDFLVKPPALSMPKGGGAIRGMGEKFATNPATGSATFTIPLPSSPTRSSLGPALALNYDSGSGNGPFGFGWHLALPAITRKTDKGLPRYRDSTDVFLLAGAEDLVPVLDAGGDVADDRTSVAGYVVRPYRPRIEGLFARIERWTRTADGDTHWRTISPDNVLTVFGSDANHRIADPADPSRIFSWLICETRDDKGNAILYDYKPEDDVDLDLAQLHESARGAAGDRTRTVNRYIDRIRYGNATTLLDANALRPRFLTQAAVDGTRWMFEVRFDYGPENPDPPDAVGAWTRRPDPFSTYRAGFEVRTYRLCRRVLLFHNFPGDPAVGADRLVRSLDFTYQAPASPDRASGPVYSMLAAAMPWSYQRDAGTWHRRSLPPLEFSYSEARIVDRVRSVAPDALENLPAGVSDGYQWIDLDGEGLAGILTEQADAWYYKPNLGEGPDGPRFGPMREVAVRPSIAALTTGRQQLLDVQGNGAVDLVDFRPPLAGFQERSADGKWSDFVPFASTPNVDWSDENLRFVDLTGDGRADALITQDDIFTWYPSEGERGFGAAERTALPLDERDGPRIVFANREEAIYVADMSGDGLGDIVRVRNGQVCYWPNLGYGRFGRQIAMDRAPSFETPEGFHPRRIRLADIDGSGTADLIYLDGNRATVWFNHSGNGWSAPQRIGFPVATTNAEQIQVVDLLGNGTACLVWSSDLPDDVGQPLRYVDLMGGIKPHLMIEMRNNLGAITRVGYAASTSFYLRDKANGSPWVTRLPFPVHCVERVTVIDERRQTTFVNTYSYHHGCFDGVEREFRGFGRVEQLDTQRFDAVSTANRDSVFVAGDHKLYQPPVKTITWFHTGIAADRGRILALYEHEYFPARYAARLPPTGFTECALPQPRVEAAGPSLEPDEWRDAMRACKGMPLRTEVFELDLAALQDRGEHEPVRLFTASQHNCHIRRLQPRGANRNAVFLVTESETLTYNYELAIGGTGDLDPDPRVSHTLNLRFDDYGRVLQSLAAVYARRHQHADPALSPAQVGLIRAVQNDERHLAYAETRYTDELQPVTVDTHRLPPPCDERSFELTGIDPAANAPYFTIDRLRDFRLSAALDTQATRNVGSLDYHEQPPNSSPRERLVERAVTRYLADDLSGPLPFGAHGRLGLVYETYQLALSDSLLDAVFVRRAEEDDFAAEARAALGSPGARSGFYASGYQIGSEVTGAAGTGAEWWIRSGLAAYEADAAQHFCLAERYIDPFGNQTRLVYDPDDLYVMSSTDAAGNVVAVEAFDRRVLAAARLKDLNDNVSETAFDIRGLPVAIAVRGKVTAAGSETGDALTMTFDELNPAPDVVAQFFETVPLDEGQARAWLGTATTRFVYHLGERYTGAVPTWAATAAGACAIVREKHERDAAYATVDLQMSFEYSDGGGQVMVRKMQAEPDPAGGANLRWIVNGLTVVNNKGKVVLQYEPYFSTNGHLFELPAAAGVSPVMFYDAAGRLVRTEFADGTLSRVEFSPWFRRTFDPNDAVLGSRWHRDRGSPSPTAALTRDLTGRMTESDDFRAAWLAAHHANTPSETHLDSLGRDVVAIVHNRTPDETGAPAIFWSAADWSWRDERIFTFTKLDAEGKPLWICDARGNLVMQCITPPKPTRTQLYDEVAPAYGSVYAIPVNAAACYDIAGNPLVQHSMDGGTRRMLMDATGQAMIAWDYNERGDATSNTVFKEHRRFTTRYDVLQRPLDLSLRIRDAIGGLVTTATVERFRYGEGRPNAKANNLRGQLWQHYDGSGLIQIEANDLSAKPRVVRRVLGARLDAMVDWTGREVDDAVAAAAPDFDGEVFTQRTEYDATGRMTRHYNWHVENPAQPGSSDRVAVYLPRYNRRGVLEKETLLVNARKIAGGHQEVAGVTRSQDAVANITYDAHGQKLTLELGNGTQTRYSYDPNTLRLVHLFTRRDDRFPNDCASNTAADARPARPCGVQNLHYTYDAAGNITHIQDDAQQTIFFANAAVEPSHDYVYDAMFRLVEATGRENAATVGAPAAPEGPWPAGAIPSPAATRTYVQRYDYDIVGNIVRVSHLAPGFGGQSGSWTRHYTTAIDSNRLIRTWLGDPDWNSNRATDKTEYEHDVHGNMLNLNAAPTAFDMRWNWNDMVHTIDLGGGGRAWYQYGADKQRHRKRIERYPARNGTIREERIYLDGFERYRRYIGDPQDPVEEIESHHLFEGQQRVLLVDDVRRARDPRPDGLTVSRQTLWRYQYGDHLGSVGVELDDAARTISREEYHPYGTTAYRTLRSAADAPPRRYRHAGMERDEESGLNYHGARCYAPSLGRWVSVDPAGLADGVNDYEYCRGNPTARTDPGGTQSSPSTQSAPRAARLLDPAEGRFEISQDTLSVADAVAMPRSPFEAGRVLDAYAAGVSHSIEAMVLSAGALLKFAIWDVPGGGMYNLTGGASQYRQQYRDAREFDTRMKAFLLAGPGAAARAMLVPLDRMYYWIGQGNSEEAARALGEWVPTVLAVIDPATGPPILDAMPAFATEAGAIPSSLSVNLSGLGPGVGRSLMAMASSAEGEPPGDGPGEGGGGGGGGTPPPSGPVTSFAGWRRGGLTPLQGSLLFQRAVDRAATFLFTDPARFRLVLSPREYGLGRLQAWATRVFAGTAIERYTAELIQNEGLPFIRESGPYNPDFLGIRELSGAVYDVFPFTEGSYLRHMARPYGARLGLFPGMYVWPQGLFLFP